MALLVGSVVCVGLICIVISAGLAIRSTVPSLWVLAGCFLLVTASVSFHLPIRLGAQRLDLAWGEAGLVIALAVLPPPWVVLITSPAVLLCYIGRQAPIKTAYNIANYTAASAAAAFVVAEFGHDADGITLNSVSGFQLLVLICGGALSGIITYLAVAAVIAVAQDVSLLATWRESGGLQVLTLGGNLGIAAAVLLLARYDILATLIVPALALFAHQRYAGRLRAHEEREAGRRKSIAIGKLTADLDEPGVVRRTADEASMLTSADIVDVELYSTEGNDPSLYRNHRDGDPWIGQPAAASRPDAHLVATVPLMAEGRLADGELRVWLAAGATKVRLSEPDQEALGILAATAAAALANARAHARQTLLATTDRATGLPIRSVLLDKIEGSGRRSSDRELPAVALILVDITGFRGVVRTLGHDAAEALLERTGRQLRNARLDDELVALVGGDDFGIYLSDAGDPADVRERALALLDAVVAPLELPVGTVTLDAVAGIAYAQTPVMKGSELLRQATVALEEARQRDLRVEFYDPGLDAMGGPAAVVMASELHDALDQGHQLEMQYQPVVHLPSGVPLAIEASVRWKHPTKGLMMAGEFLSVLEQSRDHARFVSWTLDQAVRMRALWGTQRDLPVSVNLADRCLLDTSLPADVGAVLARSGVAPDQLMLEFRESPTLTGSATALLVLDELRTLGVRVAIDGFGLGHSSLTGLLDVPATDLKIASRFVSEMLADDHAAAIVRMAIELAKQADLRVIALGVPGDEQVSALTGAGCEAAQGPHLAEPMWARELRQYLASAPVAPPEVEADVIDLDQRRRDAWPK